LVVGDLSAAEGEFQYAIRSTYVRLAGAGVADRDDVLPADHILRAGELQHEDLVHQQAHEKLCRVDKVGKERTRVGDRDTRFDEPLCQTIERCAH
jgi:hypothetical protein